MPKPKQKKKTDAPDAFFRAIQDDLSAIRRDMATKKDLERFATKDDLKNIDGNLNNLRRDVQAITEVMVSKADLTEVLRAELAKSENDELRERVLRIEEKLGMKHSHRAV